MIEVSPRRTVRKLYEYEYEIYEPIPTLSLPDGLVLLGQVDPNVKRQRSILIDREGNPILRTTIVDGVAHNIGGTFALSPIYKLDDVNYRSIANMNGLLVLRIVQVCHYADSELLFVDPNTLEVVGQIQMCTSHADGLQYALILPDTTNDCTSTL